MRCPGRRSPPRPRASATDADAVMPAPFGPAATVMVPAIMAATIPAIMTATVIAVVVATAIAIMMAVTVAVTIALRGGAGRDRGGRQEQTGCRDGLQDVHRTSFPPGDRDVAETTRAAADSVDQIARESAVRRLS